MHFFRDLYAKLRASKCSVRDFKNILLSQNEERKKSSQPGNELMKQVLVRVQKKKKNVILWNRYKISGTFSSKSLPS